MSASNPFVPRKNNRATRWPDSRGISCSSVFDLETTQLPAAAFNGQRRREPFARIQIAKCPTRGSFSIPLGAEQSRAFSGSERDGEVTQGQRETQAARLDERFLAGPTVEKSARTRFFRQAEERLNFNRGEESFGDVIRREVG